MITPSDTPLNVGYINSTKGKHSEERMFPSGIFIYPPFHIPSLLNTPLVKMIMNSQEHEQVLYTPYTDGKQQTVPIKLCPTLLTLSRGTIKLATGHSIGDSNCTV